MSDSICYEIPEDKRHYINLAARIERPFLVFRRRYPATNVIELDSEAHHYACSLALAYDNKPLNLRVFHRSDIILYRKKDKEAIKKMLPKSKIVFLETTYNENSIHQIHELMQSAAPDASLLPGVVYIFNLATDEPVLEDFNPKNDNHQEEQKLVKSTA